MRVRPHLRTLLLLALAVAARAAESAAPHPIWERLKPYRNYYAVTHSSPVSHRFSAWFVDVTYTFWQVGANSVEEVDRLEEDDFSGGWGGIALPPPTVPPIPEPVRPLAEALEARLRKLRPDLSNLKLRYEGRRRRIGLEEICRTSVEAPLERSLARRSSLTVEHEEGSTAFTFVGINFFGGLGRLVPHGDEAGVLPDFVDFVTPPALEGSSLAAAGIQELADPAHAAAWAAASERIVEIADQLVAGDYENPIEEVLEAQGEETLPPEYDGYLTYDVSAYARAEDFGDQVGVHPEFRFRLREAQAGPVTRTHEYPEIGLVVAATLHLDRQQLDLETRAHEGTTVTASYPLRGRLVRDGDRVALEGSWLEVGEEDEEKEFSLPAPAPFTEIDVYPESSAYGAAVNLPEVGEPSLD
jgi:hypothetical protein